MRLPRLLDAAGRELTRLHPSHLSCDTNIIPPHAAAIELPDTAAYIAPRLQFVEIYGPDDESLGIFRVKTKTIIYGDRVSIEAEHGIVTLEDSVVLPPATDEEIITGSMRSVLTAILGFQEAITWRLGDVDVPDDEVFTLESYGGTVLETMIAAAGLAKGYALAFDQSTAPWTVHLKRLPDAVSCECRLTRNTLGARATTDPTDICTRVYADGLPNGYMDSPLISVYGPIARRIDVAEDEDPAEKAAAYLQEHGAATMSVEVDALDVHSLTGEAMDRLALGALCRMAAPEGTVEQIITGITYSDLLGDPKKASLTLATALPNTSSSMVNFQRETSQAVAKQWKYYRELDNEAQIAAGKITLMAEDILTNRQAIGQASIRLDGAEATIQLHANTLYEQDGKITQAQIDINGAKASIDLVGEQLDDQGERLSGAEIRIDGLDASIKLKAEKTTVDALELEQAGLISRVSQAEIDIDGANAAIALKASSSDLQTLAGEVDGVKTRVSNAEIDIDGLNAAILLKADQQTVTDLATRTSAAEVAIDGANAQIALKASQTVVDEQGQRISAAEVAIDGVKSEIALKADTILLQGYVKADSLATEIANITDLSGQNFSADSIFVEGTMNAGDVTSPDGYFDRLNIGESLTVNGATVATQSWVNDKNYMTTPNSYRVEVVTGGSISKTTTNIPIYNASGTQVGTATVLTGATLNLTKNAINFYGP